VKGMLGLLERAGLVRREGDFDVDLASSEGEQVLPAVDDTVDVPLETTTSVSLDQIYSNAQIALSPYPAERLLRLIEGLKAMDDATRLQTIQAIDAADDTWSIEDPVRDAAAKMSAIEAHAAALRSSVARAERDTQERLEALRKNQETSIAEIRRQITELEGLLAREVARGAQDAASIEAAYQTQRDAVARDLGSLAQAADQFKALVAQFNAVIPTK